MKRKIGILFLSLLLILTSVLTFGQSVKRSAISDLPDGNFQADSVLYYNADSSIRFGATLRLPIGKQQCPVLIIVSGTGPQDRDGTMGGHKMFETIGNYMAKSGVAVLCVDDRGTGLTTGNYATATTADFAKDVLSAISYLKNKKEINPNKIGLLGHSEGGAVISIAASQSKDVAFLVSIAGLCTNGYEGLIRQNVALINAADMPDLHKKRYIDITTLMISTANQYKDSLSLKEKLRDVYESWLKKDAENMSKLGIKTDHFFFPFETYLRQAETPWYRFFLNYDPKNYVTKITVPILAINGDKDLMVNDKVNLENWAKYPLAAGNHEVTTLVLKNVNHLFQHCITCTTTEYASLKESFAPEALFAIAGWIKNQTQTH